MSINGFELPMGVKMWIMLYEILCYSLSSPRFCNVINVIGLWNILHPIKVGISEWKYSYLDERMKPLLETPTVKTIAWKWRYRCNVDLLEPLVAKSAVSKASPVGRPVLKVFGAMYQTDTLNMHYYHLSLEFLPIQHDVV